MSKRFAHTLALYYLEGHSQKINIITGQFFFFTNLLVSVRSSPPTFLCSDGSLCPLCNIIAFVLVKYAFMTPASTGIMALKKEGEEPHFHHSYLVPVPNLTYAYPPRFLFLISIKLANTETRVTVS